MEGSGSWGGLQGLVWLLIVGRQVSCCFMVNWQETRLLTAAAYGAVVEVTDVVRLLMVIVRLSSLLLVMMDDDGVDTISRTCQFLFQNIRPQLLRYGVYSSSHCNNEQSTALNQISKLVANWG